MDPTFNSDHWGLTVHQGTDIGPLIPHFGPPSITLPLELLFSSSKSHFGTPRYQSQGKPIAVSLLWHVNPNLNCGIPIPTPTGMVLALTTHRVDLNWAEIFGGFGFMLSDFAVQAALQWVGGKVADKISHYICNLVGPRVYSNTLLKTLEQGEAFEWAEWAALKAQIRFIERTYRYADPAVGFFIGGPMGVDAGAAGIPTPGGWLAETLGHGTDEQGRASPGLLERAGKALGEYLDNPGVDEYPTQGAEPTP